MKTQIWTDTYLNQLGVDAEQQLNKDLPCIYERQYISTTIGQSVYTLPSVVRNLLRVTWRGKKLEPVSWEELIILSPATAGGFVETSISRPQWYAMHPTNPYDIRFYPTPDEAFNGTGDPYSPIVNEAKCCIAYYRDINMSSSKTSLPAYIDRRSRKAYILWKAFATEGIGQNSMASKFYKAKYDFLVAQFRSINNFCFVSKKYSLSEGEAEVDNFRYPRPTLPTNFERVIY